MDDLVVIGLVLLHVDGYLLDPRLCAGLADAFDGDPAVIAAETRAFLAQLIERDLAQAG